LSPDFLRDNILLFGPGFVFVKLVYLFGEQHRRLEWEWVAYSLIFGLLFAAGADWAATGTMPTQVPSSQDTSNAALRFAMAILFAVVVIAIWRNVRHSGWRFAPFVRMSLSDSAWDFVLDRAAHGKCGVAVTVKRTDDEGKERETSFYGTLAAFGYETAEAEPIVSLNCVSRWDPVAGKYVRLSRQKGDGMVFHRDQILRMRIVAPESGPPGWRIRLERWSQTRRVQAAKGEQDKSQVSS
jgi:hypothetical protein